MKFDIARAWKDENYRLSLSEEERNMLPANPAGELTDDELATISGGWAGGPGIGGVGSGGVGSGGGVAPCVAPCVGNAAFVQRHTSVALICEINVFSLNLVNAAILGAVTNICSNSN